MSQRPRESEPVPPGTSKRELRSRALALRGALDAREARSREICRRFAALPEFAAAGAVFLYVHVRDEVQTAELLGRLLASDKQVVVPYCEGQLLRLFRLETMDELAEGYYGLLEPRAALRAESARQIPPEALDLLGVPGLAFDRRGGRLGHGRGYFDRLLAGLRPDAVAAGLAYECQVFPRVPMAAHDVHLDKVITEEAVYLGRGRAGRSQDRIDAERGGSASA
ncbi:MAG: 5-formyltetrahydrofolate cyclo-ligase [Pirellulales bacterium]|nr:5-formyltetrahydrofolate cyclo-ligase [Thermoguttaceae bacterium]MDD4786333.1 5-formyltetrahydrofolate cyclo-ligase [Pirellulales bacterium]MDI9442637.1 5-formyltetrahydrofolate cyclo-ligase [Planctomycetota bacterium]NLZ02100.1 5-formyltetrahydrofolate cyclo-ligase [Pirellulaceae bacterium]